jgi:3-dehydroquinate synthase
VKHGAILDPVYLADLEGEIPCVMNGEVGATGRVVVRSIEIKADVVSRDERESGLRKVLNFGHTLGHALEAAAEFSLPHGTCVALGMILEARLGEALGVTREGTSSLLQSLVDLLELPTRVPTGLSPEAVISYTLTDKKGRGGRPRYVLLSHAGKALEEEDWAREVPDDLVLEVLRQGGAM